MPGTNQPQHGIQGLAASLQALRQRLTNLETWQRTMSVPVSPWVTPTLTNLWAAHGGDPAGYFKDPLGFVHLRGRLFGGASGSAAFTLPAGFRPGNTDDLYAAAAFNGTTATSAFADIFASGAVLIYYATGTTDIGLGSITFLAEN